MALQVNDLVLFCNPLYSRLHKKQAIVKYLFPSETSDDIDGYSIKFIDSDVQMYAHPHELFRK